jgi:hypothetical protein
VKGLLTTPSGKQLTIVNVHLNYQWETIRINEIQNIKKCDKTPVILMGILIPLQKRTILIKNGAIFIKYVNIINGNYQYLY